MFTFQGDGAEDVRRRVVRLLRHRGLHVNTTLRAPDTAEQFRDMGAVLNLAVYVHGRIRDTSADRAAATIVIRSGVTGRRIASTTIAGRRRGLPSEVEEKLWQRVGAALTRACVEATNHPHRRHNAPMRIEAGTPL